jgi:WD40 repeat protein
MALFINLVNSITSAYNINSLKHKIFYCSPMMNSMYGSRSVSQTKDFPSVNVGNPPDDTISDISLLNDLVAVSSWNASVRIYKVTRPASTGYMQQSSITLQPFRVFDDKSVFTSPVLSVLLASESFCCIGLANGTLILQSMNNDAERKVIPNAHAGPIKRIKLYNNFIVTAGLTDGILKVWQFEKEVHSINTGSKIYAMDIIGEHLAVGLSNKNVKYYNMQNGSTMEFKTDFKYHIRDVSMCMSSGFNAGPLISASAVDGKFSIFNVKTNQQENTFKCHRDKPKCYSVNKCGFLTSNTDVVVTCGSEGKVQFFNRNTRVKLYENTYASPITALAIANDCIVFATGDDWSKGYQSQKLTVEMKYVDLTVLKDIPKKY